MKHVEVRSSFLALMPEFHPDWKRIAQQEFLAKKL